MESGDDSLESEANVRPRPCLTGAGSPGAQSTATDRGPSRQARLNRSAEGARTAYSARHTCPKTPETQSRNRSVRQAASRYSDFWKHISIIFRNEAAFDRHCDRGEDSMGGG